MAKKETQARGPGKFRERVVAAAKKSGMQVVGETPGKEITEPFLPEGEEQAPLPMEPPATPLAVRNGRMYVNFNEPVYSMDRNDNRIVGLVLSLRLADEHKGVIHSHIERGWNYLVGSDDKRLDINGIPHHAVEFFLAPDDGEPMLAIQGAAIEKVSIAKVEETGKGKAQHYHRLSFVVGTHAGDHVDKFATQCFGSQFWMSMWEPQTRLT